MSEPPSAPISWFEAPAGSQGLESARSLDIRPATDRLGRLAQDEGGWVVSPPDPESLTVIRRALSRLIFTIGLPVPIDIMARDRVGDLLILPRITLGLPGVWPDSPARPFEVLAARGDDAGIRCVALRLVLPNDAPGQAAGGSRSGPGRHRLPLDLVRARVLAHARGLGWPPSIAAALIGLMVNEIAGGRTGFDRMMKFGKILDLAHNRFESLRPIVARRARSPIGMLETLLDHPTRFIGKADRFATDLRAATGLDIRTPGGVAAVRNLLAEARTAAATATRALHRVRSEWIEMPRGFITDDRRAGRIDTTGAWSLAWDGRALDDGRAKLEQLGAEAPDPSVFPLPVPFTFGVPLIIPFVETNAGIRLFGEDDSSVDIAWVAMGRFAIHGLAPSPARSPPPAPAPPALPPEAAPDGDPGGRTGSSER